MRLQEPLKYIKEFHMPHHIVTTPIYFLFGRFVLHCTFFLYECWIEYHICCWHCGCILVKYCFVLLVQLHLLDVTNKSQFEIARKSINLWLRTPEQDSMFYRPAASAMNVLLGQNAAAFDNITYLLDHRIEGSGVRHHGVSDV